MSIEYEKCEKYPQCTFTECECHLNALYATYKKVRPKKKLTYLNKTILRFEIIGGKPVPIYE
jgi:hypothetical protein